jgi:hypothetical protein
MLHSKKKVFYRNINGSFPGHTGRTFLSFVERGFRSKSFVQPLHPKVTNRVSYRKVSWKTLSIAHPQAFQYLIIFWINSHFSVLDWPGCPSIKWDWLSYQIILICLLWIEWWYFQIRLPIKKWHFIPKYWFFHICLQSIRRPDSLYCLIWV